MSLARLVVTAVKIEGRTKASVARDYGIARSWVHELIRRYECEGEAGLEPRSRRPHRSPHQVDRQLEDQIVALHKQLTDQGLDAGAATIAALLERDHGSAPAVSTIWRILVLGYAGSWCRVCGVAVGCCNAGRRAARRCRAGRPDTVRGSQGTYDLTRS